MRIDNEDFPLVQLNETINTSPEGRILSKSLMINLRNSSASSVWKTYLELKGFIKGNLEKEDKNNSLEKERKDNPNTCPKCGSLLVEKAGISKKNGKSYHFWSCPNWPICSYTEPFVPEISYDQDLARL